MYTGNKINIYFFTFTVTIGGGNKKEVQYGENSQAGGYRGTS